MEGQLNFWMETVGSGAVAVWGSLDNEQRAEMVAPLARLIARLAAAPANEESNP